MTNDVHSSNPYFNSIEASRMHHSRTMIGSFIVILVLDTLRLTSTLLFPCFQISKFHPILDAAGENIQTIFG